MLAVRWCDFDVQQQEPEADAKQAVQKWKNSTSKARLAIRNRKRRLNKKATISTDDDKMDLSPLPCPPQPKAPLVPAIAFEVPHYIDAMEDGFEEVLQSWELLVLRALNKLIPRYWRYRLERRIEMHDYLRHCACLNHFIRPRIRCAEYGTALHAYTRST